MSRKKELIICIISIIVLILAITTTMFATEVPDVNRLIEDMNNNSSDNEFQQIPNATIQNNTTNQSIANTNNTNNSSNVNNNNTTSIPYTGVDYSVVIIIAICGVSAVYAYKKIRDYNV